MFPQNTEVYDQDVKIEVFVVDTNTGNSLTGTLQTHNCGKPDYLVPASPYAVLGNYRKRVTQGQTNDRQILRYTSPTKKNADHHRKTREMLSNRMQILKTPLE